MTYDDWLTSDPEDREICAYHMAMLPCLECRMEKYEDVDLRYEEE